MKEYSGNMVTIMSCSDCNVKCKHCYISYKGNFDEKSLFDLVKILSKKYTIRINGSEPLIHSGYLKSYKRAKQHGPLTNGLIFKNNYGYLDEIKKYGMSELYISYHFDWHDSISKVDKKYLINLFSEIKKRKLNFVIMCSITSKNYNKILDYCNEAFNFGASGIKFTNFLQQGNATNLNKNLILSKKQKAMFFKLLNIARESYNEKVFFIRRCGSFGPDKNNVDKFNCIAGINNICITPDLNVYPCVFLAKPGNEIGRVIDNKIMIYDWFTNDGNR